MQTPSSLRRGYFKLNLKTLFIVAFLFSCNRASSQNNLNDTIQLSELKRIDPAEIDALYVNDQIAKMRVQGSRQLLASRTTFTEFLRFREQAEKASRSANKDYDQTFTKLEFEGAYPGGMVAWLAYLKKNFIYPKFAIERELQGTVVVSIIIDANGTISNVEAVSGPADLKQAAVDLVRASGQWLPGIQNMKLVKSYKKVIVPFRLEDKRNSSDNRSTE